MEQGQFSDQPIVAILQQAERGDKTVPDICREHNRTETSFYQWRKKFGGLDASDIQRLKERERENGSGRTRAAGRARS